MRICRKTYNLKTIIQTLFTILLSLLFTTEGLHTGVNAQGAKTGVLKRKDQDSAKEIITFNLYRAEFPLTFLHWP